MNIIYYDIQETNTIENYLTIGPFYFIQEQVLIELILFLPSFLLVSLFRRTKTRHSRSILPIYNNNNKQYLFSNKKNQKSKLLLSWWCLIIVYMISFLFIGIFIIFILNRSIYIGDIKTRIWLASILLSFMSSIFLTQPLKVFGLTLFCMCICRNKHSNDFDFDDDHLISLTCQKYVSNTNEHIQRSVK
ncbi:unnamed protein product [Rotaria sp. Silwood1]|nr:unnamed protein product [Rotaria sp. Silwood1]